MLAAAASAEDLSRLRYPLLASPKLDGIRCIVHPRLGPVSRSFKPIPNAHVREVLKEFVGVDGEIMSIGVDGKVMDFNSIQSAVMSHHGTPEIQIWAFDYIDGNFSEASYLHRLAYLRVSYCFHPIVMPLRHDLMHNPEQVQEFMASCLSEGYEGIVLRDPDAQYKCGRSTLKQQGMIKYKEFQDAEGVVVGFEELYHNQNPQERDNFGLAERSDKKAGMVAANTLGALVLDTRWGQLSVGSGFDLALRDRIWNNRADFIGRTVTFKYQTHGMQSLPRFPIFLRFREQE